MKKKIIIILSIIILITILSVIFIKNYYKNSETGNTNIKSAKDLEEYILNISSYEADINVSVTSNKSTNKYRINQKFMKPNIFKQEIIEPESIQGLTTSYDGTTLKIDNTKLQLSKIFENYEYIYENSLCLDSFIKDYKSSENSSLKEEENTIIMETKVNNENKYLAYKKLYIDKNTRKPTKMEIEDINKKMLVYILYNEIKINSTNKEEVLAFKLRVQEENI